MRSRGAESSAHRWWQEQTQCRVGKARRYRFRGRSDRQIQYTVKDYIGFADVTVHFTRRRLSPCNSDSARRDRAGRVVVAEVATGEGQAAPRWAQVGRRKRR